MLEGPEGLLADGWLWLITRCWTVDSLLTAGWGRGNDAQPLKERGKVGEDRKNLFLDAEFAAELGWLRNSREGGRKRKH